MLTPLVQRIAYQDPLKIFAQFAGQEGAVFLDSAVLREHCGRYSYIAMDPFATLTSKNGLIALNGKSFTGDPFAVLQEQLANFHLPSHLNLPPFQGGVAGFFSYDLYQHLESIPLHRVDDLDFPDMVLGFYDLVMAFDHETQEAWIFSSGFPELKPAHREARAQERIAWAQAMLMQTDLFANETVASVNDAQIHANFTAETYQHAVQTVIDYILAGDIFEACISQRFQTLLPAGLTPFNLYCRLRAANPAPFAAYLQFANIVIASASPERFLKLVQGHVETRPIKGTRPRGKTEAEDRQLADELVQSEKDHAENVMIVDLLRNDLSRVCQDGSVHVSQLCGLESYAAVHHLVSVITGDLQADVTAVDLLRATFPGGSITGAPKIRAMEIIAEIEPTQRGPYCGSVAYIGFNGDMDSSIVIRTYVVKDNVVSFQAGGAVVADSDPQTEYDETLTKANALRRALTHDITHR